ncbi:MAG: serine acetyltransferase [Proteobacteria bacterium]|nr:serine acetyltransferase [Pseudomonadota bacterium]
MKKQDGPTLEESLSRIHEEILETYDLQGGINYIDGINQPSYADMVDVVRQIMYLLFPGFYSNEKIRSGNLGNWSGNLLDGIYRQLKKQILKSLFFKSKDERDNELVEDGERITLEVLQQIPKIRILLKKDVTAAYHGDPAAKSHEEVIMSYPAILAIALHRIAHEIYLLNLPIIPRMISEYAHQQTGIDIHPGARIGESFFIDHGTGVVIGETCEIGRNVKIYQMVTLGALSFTKDEKGKLLKGTKRHPTIEDDVVLYAGCTILGGNTVIGRGSVIGGNVWITESVDPGTVITFDVQKQEYHKIRKTSPR